MPYWAADEPIAGGVRDLGPKDAIKDAQKQSPSWPMMVEKNAYHLGAIADTGLGWP